MFVQIFIQACTLLEQQLVSHYPDAWQCGRGSCKIETEFLRQQVPTSSSNIWRRCLRFSIKQRSHSRIALRVLPTSCYVENCYQWHLRSSFAYHICYYAQPVSQLSAVYVMLQRASCP